MGSTLEDIIAAGNAVAMGLPGELMYGRTFEEFSDDDVPACSSCCQPCEWIYFSSAALKKIQGEAVNWCGQCAQSQIRDGPSRKRFKVHVRTGLYEHMAAVKRLESQVKFGPNPRASSEALHQPPRPRVSFNLPPLAAQAQMSPPVVARAPETQTGATPGTGAVPRLTAEQKGKMVMAVDEPEPPAHPEMMSQAMAKFTVKMGIVLSQYFVTGPVDEFTTCGAEVVAQYKKHFRCAAPPQWKQVYQVLTALGYQCKQETVLTMQGTTRQLTRVVGGLKVKSSRVSGYPPPMQQA